MRCSDVVELSIQLLREEMNNRTKFFRMTRSCQKVSNSFSDSAVLSFVVLIVAFVFVFVFVF